MSKNRLLNMEYSALQGAYWMSFGVIISFAAVFLHDRGYTNSELGVILALGNIAALILQPIVASFADRSRKWSLPAIIAAITLVMTLAQLANCILPGRSAMVGLCYALYICCTFLIQPLISSVAAYLENSGAGINFGLARGIGSACYAVIVSAVGVAVERIGALLVPAAGVAASLLLLAALLVLPRSKSPEVSAPLPDRQDSRSAIEFLRSAPGFVLLLLGLSLRYFSHALINNFMINIVENLGGSSADMGALNAYSAILELPAMFFFAFLLRRWSSSTLFKFSLVMFAVKGFAVFLAPSMPLLYAAQLTQALSFALYIPASVQYVVDTVPYADQVKGQAYITATISLGSILASLLGGVMFDRLGVSTTLLVSAIITAAGVAMALPAIKKTEKV